MKAGSLFSGIGGFDLGLERAGMSIEWQVENNDYCREVLKKHWPKVPCHYDITTIDWRDIPRVDLVCGGFPCQPFSLAGKRRGKADDRYLWPEVVRCLDSLRPTWFLGENVPGIINLALDQVCTDLESLGYEVATFNIPACAVDAPHIRKRVWILAHTEGDLRGASRDDGPEALNGSHSLLAAARSAGGERWREEGICGISDEQNAKGERGESNTQAEGYCEDVPNPSQLRRRQRDMHARGSGQGTGTAEEWTGSPDVRGWPAEPSICRVVDGVPNRSHRLKGLGNAIVPQIVEALGRMIVEAEGALTDAT